MSLNVELQEDGYHVDPIKDNIVRSETNAPTVPVAKIATVTQAQYDALTPASDTLYVVVAS